MSCLLVGCLQERVVIRAGRLIVERECSDCLLLLPKRMSNHSALLTSLCHVGMPFAALGVRPDVLLVIAYYGHAVSVAKSIVVVKSTTLKSSEDFLLD